MTVTFEVERYVRKAGLFEGRGHVCGHLGRQGAMHFIRSQFDSSEPVVQPHAELAESQGAESRFAFFNECQAFGRNFYAVG